MKSDMPIVILCGGQGTRLREETEFKPKPMVKIGRQPILWHIQKIYAAQGFKKFILCLGCKGEMIRDYYYHYEVMNSDFTISLSPHRTCRVHGGHGETGWEITLSDTGEQALKGARLKRIEKYVETDDFMVTYGDGLADVDVKKLLAFHRAHGKIATVTGVRPRFLRFGEIEVGKDHSAKFAEKPKYSGNYINGGFYVFKRSLFDLLRNADDCDLEMTALEQLSEEGEVKVYPHDGFWWCMDTIRDAEYLNDLWQNGKAEWKIW